MAKSRKTPKLNQDGQLSIFLGISLVIIISLMAFVINVGLFVKAKINLQNAVDSAAWSGAAVQARQLSNIAHLNWEMRNTFKEWMFKYYVLGQLGTDKLKPGNVTPGTNMNFTLKQFSTTPPTPEDKYNIPSICIHFGAQHNICGIYSLPGLPRFNNGGIPGIVDLQENLLDSLARTKAENCSIRTDLNFATAMIWAYGTKKAIFQNSPTIASHRTGAWIQAMELALRVRNLEMMVNRPPVKSLCIGQGGGCTDVNQLSNDQPQNVAFNERPIKAFMSAYRNISGGDRKKEGSQNFDELAGTFRLEELRPTPFIANSSDLSGFLIPQTANIGTTSTLALEKYYLDLQVTPVNYATFFSAFISTSRDRSSGIISNVASDAACGITKTALPVPGYPLGFVKNPQVLTYYAVKGSAKFIGLFFPFQEREGIELKAYASAKPFGGRIGPRIFDISTSKSIDPRQVIKKTTSYAGTIRTSGNTFTQADPLPLTDFWAGATGNVGGTPSGTTQASFVFPNLVYDLSGNMNEQVNSGSSEPLLFITPTNLVVSQVGLYDSDQFTSFSSNLVGNTGSGTLSPEQIDEALEKVRSPTNYEAMNYLIPTFTGRGVPDENLESVSTGFVTKTNPVNNTEFYQLYGPLFGVGTLYQNADAIKGIILQYLKSIEPAVLTFTGSLSKAADSIRGQVPQGTLSGSTASDIYNSAAATIHPIGSDLTVNASNCNDLSIAHKFKHFILAEAEECGILPLSDQISEYIDTEAGRSQAYQSYYESTYVPNPTLTNALASTGYMPGRRQGATPDGRLPHPFGVGQILLAKRNHYSVKYVGMEKLATTASSIGYGDGIFPIFIDGSSPNESLLELSNSNFPLSGVRNINILEAGQLDEFAELTH